jgi:hypothetical protein
LLRDVTASNCARKLYSRLRSVFPILFSLPLQAQKLLVVDTSRLKPGGTLPIPAVQAAATYPVIPLQKGLLTWHELHARVADGALLSGTLIGAFLKQLNASDGEVVWLPYETFAVLGKAVRGLQPQNVGQDLWNDEEGIISKSRKNPLTALREFLEGVMESRPTVIGIVVHHEGGVGHWTLSTIRLEGGKVCIKHYDSLGIGVSRSDSKALRLLATEVYGPSARVAEDEVFTGGRSPQANAIDCGVFVCIFGWLKSMGASKQLIRTMDTAYGEAAVPSMRTLLRTCLANSLG